MTRARNEGTVYQDTASGRWVAEISAGVGADGRRRRVKRRARTKTEAVTKLQELRRQNDLGLPTGRGRMSIDDLLDHFENVVLPARELSTNTLDNYRWSFRHLRSGLGKHRVTALAPHDVDAFLLDRREVAKLSRSCLRRLRAHLSATLDEAQRRGWVHRNVADLAYVPPSHRRERRSMTHEQVAKLLSAAQGHRLEAAVILAVTRGLRPGELFGLQWSDLNLDGAPPTMSVRRSLKREHNKLRLGDPKTPQSIRDLVLPESVVSSLRTHRKQQTAERLANADLWQDLDLVFCTEVGTLVDPSNFRRALASLTDRAGIGHWAPYELRHTAISLLADGGIALDQLADLAGHRDATTLLAHYRHKLTTAVDAGSALANDLAAISVADHG